MATPEEFRTFCASVDCGPGLYAVEGPGYIQIGSMDSLRQLSQQRRRIICVARIARDTSGEAERMLRRQLRIQGWDPDRVGRVYVDPRAVASCMRLVHRLVRGRGFFTASGIKRIALTDPPGGGSPLHGLPTFRRVLDDIGADSPLHGLPTFRRVLDGIGADSPLHGLPAFRRVLNDIGADSPLHGPRLDNVPSGPGRRRHTLAHADSP